ncbi:Uncharacterized conserved protein, contains HEPN domain [Sphingomonas sp. YR710]|jgi:uncharacterized protein with HEPN domain|uniref:HepT-like ribonuclease domain-containing protein n=1 Tax=Sphingomonas sp. YR710 TaxID=1882773 RepID=UPI000887FB45|nr:HepT-like ribonuclease domain-containing protein [Sphingomonas sp. YR710]SDD35559.1 Uncharacterized conserved protein, contains HEPN domain [Sphingomonas sp. YR710]
MAPSLRDVDHLELMLQLIDAIERRLNGMLRPAFEADQDEIDLTAFRLGHIGEAAQKLSEPVRERHPQIDWRSIYGMRNVIAHNYGAILPSLLWNVVEHDLEALRLACRTELDRLTK